MVHIKKNFIKKKKKEGKSEEIQNAAQRDKNMKIWKRAERYGG